MKTTENFREAVAQGLKLPLMEAFYTIQGEGAFTGQAAYFIRLAGCDVGCVWCDVKESWEESEYSVVSVDDIVKNAARQPSKFVVITGGEPCMHNLDYLCSELHARGFKIHIETSGAHPLRGDINWVCLSPKKFKAPLTEVCDLADELKVVIFHKSDFEWAEKYAGKVPEKCRLFLQPEWSKANRMMPLIIDYVKENPEWCISLQTHKYMNIP